jgi:Tfp pilus assembly protein PilF
MASDRIAELLELLEDEPDDALLRLTLGNAYLEIGNPGAALAHLEHAVTIDPRYSAAYRSLGAALERLGRPAEAASAWERGVAVAEQTGDIQAGKEMLVFLGRLRGQD